VGGGNGGGSGGGILNTGGVLNVINTSFTLNSADIYGHAIYNGYSINVANSIFWNNGIGGYQLYGPPNGSINYSIVQGGFPGTGNINSNPLFNNPATRDLHVMYNSPAIDAGDN